MSGFIIVILLALLPDNPYLRRVDPVALEARSAKRDHSVYLDANGNLLSVTDARSNATT